MWNIDTYPLFRAADAYRRLRDEASDLLSQIYSNNTVTEWLSDKIDDRISDAQEQKNKIETVQSSYDTRWHNLFLGFSFNWEVFFWRDISVL